MNNDSAIFPSDREFVRAMMLNLSSKFELCGSVLIGMVEADGEADACSVATEDAEEEVAAAAAATETRCSARVRIGTVLSAVVLLD